jgi:hypothetical protein
MAEQNPVLRVCSLLNRERAKYLIIGGQAIILHGLVRTTEDVDILIEPSDDNCKRVLTALRQLEDGAAKQLTPRDLQDSLEAQLNRSVAAGPSFQPEAGSIDPPAAECWHVSRLTC